MGTPCEGKKISFPLRNNDPRSILYVSDSDDDDDDDDGY
ncbi:hypothetical protein Lser_V15G20562 [Lactuca serriola]